MRWSNVAVIARREIRDQLRDRRTLFMIFALPILLYPILGIGVVQFSAAFEQKPRTAIVVGAGALPDAPPLLSPTRDTFDPSLFDNPDEAARLHVILAEPGSGWDKEEKRREALRGGLADAVVMIPPDVRSQLDTTRKADIPIAYNSTDEPSQVTYLRLREVIARWRDRIVDKRLAAENKPAEFVEPIRVKAEDVATRAEQGSSVWARLFPFLLVMMSLTGAFYPAVDLCAGEKERGTMETLLISPASRGEIVMGKFLTVVLASITTALLNLLSMGLTGMQLARQVGAMSARGMGGNPAAAGMAPPSLTSGLWMILLLIPLSVFFSAICVALAVLAKSMKEGQYYMTPLYLISLPLTVLTLMPGIELNLFFSLVPITGVSLLLRSLILGDYATARQFFLPVLLPTIVYGAIALRWAVDQFKREDVLFRDAERFSLGDWLRHLIRDKEATPGPGQALLCFVLMISSAWFVLQFMPVGASATLVMGAGQAAFILGPPLLLTLLFASDWKETLRLRMPRGRDLALAVGLAFSLNPLVRDFGHYVDSVFPVPDAVKTVLAQMMDQLPGLGSAIVLFALIPAVCEEFAFRGYILAGLQRGYSTRTSILLSAVMFGILHVLLSLFQQLFPGTLLGLVLGLIAIKSRSIVPGIVFHAINNSLGIVVGTVVADPSRRDSLRWLFRDPAEALFQPIWVAVAVVASAGMLWALIRETPPVQEDLIAEPNELALNR
ncbi:ABC transporter permease subunit/CPBP intramembrane protease [Isosphaeraceae bacterium EP7]